MSASKNIIKCIGDSRIKTDPKDLVFQKLPDRYQAEVIIEILVELGLGLTDFEDDAPTQTRTEKMNPWTS